MISPGCASNETARSSSPTVKSRTRMLTGAGAVNGSLAPAPVDVGAGRGGNNASGSMPTMASTISAIVAAARSAVRTMRPLRITVMRSAIWNTSSRRCDT
jgi:hypothetical protein